MTPMAIISAMRLECVFPYPTEHLVC